MGVLNRPNRCDDRIDALTHRRHNDQRIADGLHAEGAESLAPLAEEPITCSDTHLDALQAEAVRRALNTPDVSLLQGLPGTNWNQPWYQPQCNITPNSSNPAYDGDAGTLDPNASPTVPYPHP